MPDPTRGRRQTAWPHSAPAWLSPPPVFVPNPPPAVAAAAAPCPSRDSAVVGTRRRPRCLCPCRPVMDDRDALRLCCGHVRLCDGAPSCFCKTHCKGAPHDSIISYCTGAHDITELYKVHHSLIIRSRALCTDTVELDEGCWGRTSSLDRHGSAKQAAVPCILIASQPELLALAQHSGSSSTREAILSSSAFLRSHDLC